ncbi:DUF6480 family protein [Streptomyces sp. SL13]|jgi:hypothetical protein|uniref:DUF6480 family protein n=1 Tax=Streptantibioticus silvisoli TaxID=2705255 RepID=A0AA90KBP0_9ACTN|nr:DUF6480 family protein [Streptantibioticus silvisoli]MDI5967377.1 DUF6480 family protein [Streptantibioticus silvisoli]MDI5973933.1 DUF6480 family protein [Streptantibioticus silvisoli]
MSNADPDPDTTAGLEPGGGVPPGETPPAEGSTPDAGPSDAHNPTKGWGKGPMVVIALVVLFVLAFFVVRIVAF